MRSILLFLAALAGAALLTAQTESDMQIRSTAFDHDGKIPRKYTCEGRDTSPDLSWSAVPRGTRSLALIVEDPDAPDPAKPKMTWVHWVLYDLPPDSAGLGEGVVSSALPRGTRQGLNDWKRTGWGGPCPPIGRHRYFFKLYALDSELGDLGQPTRAALLARIKDHVLGEAVVMGTYAKGDP